MSIVNNNGHLPNGTINGSWRKPDAATVSEHDLQWDGLSPAVTQALSEPLHPGLVSLRNGRGGKVFGYIEGHTAITEANSVFGFGGWGYELVENVSLRRIETVNPRTGEVKVVSAYSAPVRVTVPGAPPRTDIGFHAVTDETAEGHETAIKGAVTDGMKRALRSFGDRFGNGLYGDQQAKVNPTRWNRPIQETQGGDSDSQLGTLRKRLFEIAEQQGFNEEKVLVAVQRQTGKGLDDLTVDEVRSLVEAAANKLREKRERDA